MVLGPLIGWLLILSVGLPRYGRQALWALLGAPVAFFNVINFGFWLWTCTHHPTIGSCP